MTEAAAETSRLLCRRPPVTASEDYRGLFTEPNVEKWLRPPPMRRFDGSDFDRMLARDRSHWQKHGFGPWFLIDRETGDFVGRAGLNWTVVEGVDEVELPWAVKERFQGQGLASEAAAAAIEAAREARIERVVSLTLVENRASRRVMEKIGLEFSGNVSHAGLTHALYFLEL